LLGSSREILIAPFAGAAVVTMTRLTASVAIATLSFAPLTARK
jgi:hypothetical protein